VFWVGLSGDIGLGSWFLVESWELGGLGEGYWGSRVGMGREWEGFRKKLVQSVKAKKDSYNPINSNTNVYKGLFIKRLLLQTPT
jgi:hypothetical protein